MSGGHFDYQQYRISQMAEDIRILIETNDSKEKNSYGDQIGRGYSQEVIEKFREAVKILETAYVYVQRIDWLVSDGGEESFLEQLESDLSKINERNS